MNHSHMYVRIRLGYNDINPINCMRPLLNLVLNTCMLMPEKLYKP